MFKNKIFICLPLLLHLTFASTCFLGTRNGKRKSFAWQIKVDKYLTLHKNEYNFPILMIKYFFALFWGHDWINVSIVIQLHTKLTSFPANPKTRTRFSVLSVCHRHSLWFYGIVFYMSRPLTSLTSKLFRKLLVLLGLSRV